MPFYRDILDIYRQSNQKKEMAEYFMKVFYLSDSGESEVVVLLGYNSLRYCKC